MTPEPALALAGREFVRFTGSRCRPLSAATFGTNRILAQTGGFDRTPAALRAAGHNPAVFDRHPACQSIRTS